MKTHRLEDEITARGRNYLAEIVGILRDAANELEWKLDTTQSLAGKLLNTHQVLRSADNATGLVLESAIADLCNLENVRGRGK